MVPQEKENDFVTRDEFKNAIGSLYRRTKKERDDAIKDKFKEACRDIDKLEERMIVVERELLPLSKTVEFLQEDVSEIKSDVKEGFKEMKETLKEFKTEVKEDIECNEKNISALSEKVTDSQTAKGPLEYIKSAEGIMVSLITASGPVIIVIIKLFA